MAAFSPYVFIYYLIVALLGGFFVVNLFLAVVFDEFMRSKELNEVAEEIANRAASVAERENAPDGNSDTDKLPLVAPGKAVSSVSSERSLLRQLVDTNLFQTISMSLLLANMIVMCMPYAGQAETHTKMLEELTVGFSLLFCLEIAVKYVAMAQSEFLSDSWNVFDSALVSVTAADLIVTTFGLQDAFNVMYLRVLRMLRVLRIMRLMQYWKGLFRIFTCLLGAGQQLVNIFVLLFVFMTMFALLGMQVSARAPASVRLAR